MLGDPGRPEEVGERRQRAKSLALVAVTLVIVLMAAAPALAQSPDNIRIRGLITNVGRSAEVVLVEEDPSDKWGSDKGKFTVTNETEILERQGGKLTPASFEVLRVGQLVEATYAGPVAESYPSQGTAGRIVILDKDPTDTPDDGGPAVLPDTGGAPLPVLGVFLIASGLLARRIADYSLR